MPNNVLWRSLQRLLAHWLRAVLAAGPGRLRRPRRPRGHKNSGCPGVLRDGEYWTLSEMRIGAPGRKLEDRQLHRISPREVE